MFANIHNFFPFEREIDLIDLKKCNRNICLQKSASIQPRACRKPRAQLQGMKNEREGNYG